MDQRKKEIIIHEIRHWKAHKLLPEHYCNFLLTLYTEGADDNDDSNQVNNKISIFKFVSHAFLSLIALFLPLTFLVIYFTEFSLVLQIVIFVIFIIIAVIGSWFHYKKKNWIFHFPLLTALLIFLLSSLHIVANIVPSFPSTALIVILLHCLLWVIIGYKLKISYLIVSGGLGSLLLLIYYFS